MNILLLAATVLALIAFGEARYKTQRTYTNTGTLDQCLQKIEPKVCDPHGVFTTDERERLNGILASLEESTKREGYPMSTATKKCGMTGITLMPIMVKAEMINTQEVQRQLNDINKEFTDQHPCKRIAIVLLQQSEKIDRRSFWAGVNWNTNVKPGEIVAMYRKEIPRVTKAHYTDALYNIVQEFMTTATQRLQVPFPEAPMTRTYTTTGTRGQGYRGQTKYTTQNEQPEETERETPTETETETERTGETERKHKYAGKKTTVADRTEEKGEFRKTEAAGTDVEEEEETEADDEMKRKHHRKPKKHHRKGGGTYAKSTDTAKEEETSD